MKANYRGRLRNLLCILLGVVIVVASANPAVVEAVASNSNDSDARAAFVAELEEETEQETEDRENTEDTSDEINLAAGVATVLDTDCVFTQEDTKKTEETETEEETESKDNASSENNSIESNSDKQKETQAEESKNDKQKDYSSLIIARVNEYVNIRKAPEKEAQVEGVLYKECGGTLLEQKGDWSKIKSGNVEGWVMNEYLYIGKEAEQYATESGLLKAIPTTQSLRVRKESNEGAGIYGLLALNEAVAVIEAAGKWIQVSYKGKTGYVAADYVTVEISTDEAESIEEIIEREKKAEEEKAKRNAQKEAVLTSASEVDILAALIQCEAGGESFDGQIAVGAVVMNRVRCASYPNNITDVIYASGQFGPAATGKINSLVLNGTIKESCRQAAQAVISGTCNIGDALHFRRTGTKSGYQIGNHVFW